MPLYSFSTVWPNTSEHDEGASRLSNDDQAGRFACLLIDRLKRKHESPGLRLIVRSKSITVHNISFDSPGVFTGDHAKPAWSQVAFEREQAARLSRTFHNMDLDLSDFIDAEVAIVDAVGAIVHGNRKWDETARSGQLLPNLHGWNYIAECEAASERGSSDASRILAGLRAVLNGERSSFVDVYACPFNGRYHWYQIQITAVDLNNKRHAILMHVDVSALQCDSLTGLANRAMFDAQLDLAVSSAVERQERAGVIIVDVNGMKHINDVYGHRAGDEALRAVTAEMKKLCAADCILARIGGDEFGVVLSANYDALTAARLRARLKSGIVFATTAKGKPVFVSASVGAASYPENGTTVSELLESADKSMYAQKRGSSVAI
jgi:diguanylate cyclase (GGDEF)-like protein